MNKPHFHFNNGNIQVVQKVYVKHLHLTLAFISQKNLGDFAKKVTDHLNKDANNTLLEEK